MWMLGSIDLPVAEWSMRIGNTLVRQSVRNNETRYLARWEATDWRVVISNKC